jgi:peptidyl-prolyl cis-trans isomerase A (cyclophilin A)
MARTFQVVSILFFIALLFSGASINAQEGAQSGFDRASWPEADNDAIELSNPEQQGSQAPEHKPWDTLVGAQSSLQEVAIEAWDRILTCSPQNPSSSSRYFLEVVLRDDRSDAYSWKRLWEFYGTSIKTQSFKVPLSAQQDGVSVQGISYLNALTYRSRQNFFPTDSSGDMQRRIDAGRASLPWGERSDHGVMILLLQRKNGKWEMLLRGPGASGDPRVLDQPTSSPLDTGDALGSLLSRLTKTTVDIDAIDRGRLSCERAKGSDPFAPEPVSKLTSEGIGVVGAVSGTYDRALLSPALLNTQAPDSYHVKFETSRGDFAVTVTRAWSPLGADRFYDLVKYHYFDGTRIFRVLPHFVAQFGLSAYPAVNAAWANARIKDDPPVQSNRRGTIGLVAAGPNTRGTQLFINLKDNSSLDGRGFTPIGSVDDDGMKVVDMFYSQYGDNAGADQDAIARGGEKYIALKWPNLDVIKRSTVAPIESSLSTRPSTRESVPADSISSQPTTRPLASDSSKGESAVNAGEVAISREANSVSSYAVLSIRSGFLARPGDRNPLSHIPLKLMRQDFAATLRSGGIQVGPGATPRQVLSVACAQSSSACVKAINASVENPAASALSDMNGNATFPAVPPGTYHLMIYAYDDSHRPICWNPTIELKAGPNVLTIKQDDAVLLR